MTFEEWIKDQPDGYYSNDAIFQAGAASRDAEFARLRAINSKLCEKSNWYVIHTARLEEERDQLRAQINVLRDAFQTFIDEHEECQDADEWMAELCSSEALHVAGEELATTPEQSLAEYRNKVIEDCAVKADALANCEENTDGYRNGAAWCAEAIRAMKEQL